MDRSIPMLLIGLVFGGGIGFTVAASNGITLDGHDHNNPQHHGSHAKNGSHAMKQSQAQPSGRPACTTGKGNKQMAGHHKGHGSHRPLELAPDEAKPSISIALKADPVSGWNLHVTTSQFRFAPENASRTHVAGEGHGHVYINGKKHARIYGPWVHIPQLPAAASGKAAVRVGLYSNDHRPFHVDGKAVSDEVSVETCPPAKP